MADSENAASKKRVAGTQISKDNPELDDDGPEPEMGTFKRASDEVLAARRIVKVRRSQPKEDTPNPFATLCMVPPSDSGANSTNPSALSDTAGDKTEVEDGAENEQEQSEEGKGTESETLVARPNGTDVSNKEIEGKTDISSGTDGNRVDGNAVGEAIQPVEAEKDVENGEAASDAKAGEETAKDKEATEAEPSTAIENPHEEEADEETEQGENKNGDVTKSAPSLSSFQQLSSTQNAFTGFSGTGFGTSSFSFGSIVKEGPTFGASSGSAFGASSVSAFGATSSLPSFGFGASNNGSSSWKPSATSGSGVTKSGVPSMQEVSVETGEENEKAVFTADAILYEYADGGWKERGKGELKLNVSLSDAEKARLIMRARGNYRLIMNASLYPDMTLANMEKKGITFACINSAGEGTNGFSTFALKFKDSSFVEEFRGAVEAHKGRKTAVLKTPENSPKASDE